MDQQQFYIANCGYIVRIFSMYSLSSCKVLLNFQKPGPLGVSSGKLSDK